MTAAGFFAGFAGFILLVLIINRTLAYALVSRRIARVRKKNLSLHQHMLLAYARMAHYTGDDVVAVRYLDEIEKESPNA